ncbi:hypothetical protein AB0B31_33230 [Catellatospora citrea]|uniref:VMAP-C domain-containing protein n=1 Tax=Catellatospora citrea TaxID=53366 RepID=UPI0033EFDBB5
MERARLSVAQQHRLADALLSCDCVRDRRVRDQVLQTLPSDALGHHFALPRQEADRADVIGILNAFAAQPGGLHALLTCIELFEPGTVAVIALRRLIGEFEPDPMLSAEQRASLDDLLAGIVCAEAEHLYWESVGEFGPPPTGTGNDLLSLTRDLSDAVGGASGSLPPLLAFLCLLAPRVPARRVALQQWVENYALSWGIDPRELARQRLALEGSTAAPVASYLILQMEEYGAEPDRYLLSAWFQRGRMSKVLRRGEEPIPVEQLPAQIDFMLTRDAEVTRDATSRLVVELILPRRLITADVDQWPIAPADFERPVGTQHAVVVRPLERHHAPALHRDWRRKWEWLKEHGGDPAANDAAAHWIKRPTEVNPKQLMIQLRSTDAPVCICLAFAPQAAQVLGSSDEYAAGVHAGAPVILWCRDGGDRLDIEQEIRALLAGNGLLTLPELIHRYRQEAHYPDADAAHLGRHLTLLWDDYDRRPDEFGNLLAPTRGTQ